MSRETELSIFEWIAQQWQLIAGAAVGLIPHIVTLLKNRREERVEDRKADLSETELALESWKAMTARHEKELGEMRTLLDRLEKKNRELMQELIEKEQAHHMALMEAEQRHAAKVLQLYHEIDGLHRQISQLNNSASNLLRGRAPDKDQA